MDRYGIEIRNDDGRLILDNTAYHTLTVKTTGTVSRNVSLYDATLRVSSGQTLFLRPSVVGKSMWCKDEFKESTVPPTNPPIYTTNAGNIAYIKAESMALEVPDGYGLAIYDEQEKPKMVFKSNIKFLVFRASAAISQVTFGDSGEKSTVLELGGPPPKGKYRYVSANAFSMINYDDDNSSWYGKVWEPSATFNADQTKLTLSVKVLSNVWGKGRSRTSTKTITVVEA